MERSLPVHQSSSSGCSTGRQTTATSWMTRCHTASGTGSMDRVYTDQPSTSPLPIFRTLSSSFIVFWLLARVDAIDKYILFDRPEPISNAPEETNLLNAPRKRTTSSRTQTRCVVRRWHCSSGIWAHAVSPLGCEENQKKNDRSENYTYIGEEQKKQTSATIQLF